MYQPKEYPKMVYHKTYKPKLVKDQQEHEELGPDWISSPAHVDKAPYPKMVHHKKYAPKVVKNAQEHAALGADWGALADEPAPSKEVSKKEMKEKEIEEPKAKLKSKVD